MRSCPTDTHSTVSLFVHSYYWEHSFTTFCKERDWPFPFHWRLHFLVTRSYMCLSHSNSIDQPAGTLSHLFMTCLSSWTIHLPQTEAMPLDSPNLHTAQQMKRLRYLWRRKWLLPQILSLGWDRNNIFLSVIHTCLVILMGFYIITSFNSLQGKDTISPSEEEWRD